ncbi:uracil-DNA glycosylase family protein [Sphingomonas sp. 1P06PA]|uniref:uracil-DNA glycosylase family protein n=1 Tax=Sphingomonas sp. 1P06PA TaxID=554121 RepID=UPI0039A488A1
MGYLDGLGAEALSVLGWWQEAGVDTLVEDAPRDWLARAPSAAPASAEAPAAPVPAALPKTREALIAWLADAANLPALGPRRIAPAGDPASALMILADMPDPDDRETLFEGRAGQLFDAILAAISMDRSSIYLAALCPARPAGGRLAAEIAAPLAEAARAHVAAVAPKALLLFGREAGAAFGLSAAPGRRNLQSVNHSRGTTAAIVTHHPRMMIGQPARKADAWADISALIGEMKR